MTGMTMLWRAGSALALAALLLGATGCGALDVSDPTAIEEKDLSNATGAELTRRNALATFYVAVGSGAQYGGLLTDEFVDSPFKTPADVTVLSGTMLTDRRDAVALQTLWNSSSASIPYANWQQARFASSVALDYLRAYAPDSLRNPYVGQMLAVRGYATLRLGEDICPGFGLHDAVNGELVKGQPVTTEGAFERALADFDEAVIAAADSIRIRSFARVGRARALLELGRFADAAAAAAEVPVDFVINAEYTTSGVFQPNLIGSASASMTIALADGEAGVGLDFVSAADPRVQLTLKGTAPDGVTQVYAPAKYPTATSPIVTASGIEARLIQAEAALNTGGDWLSILNELRAARISPAMPALSDPGTPEARVDLLFRERAFWLLGTGTRLADLRRLIRLYGRAPESLFPAGSYRLGGEYGAATSLPFAAQLEGNPAVTGCAS